MARYVLLITLVFSSIACASHLHAGQYSNAKRELAAAIEASKHVKLPVAERPLPAGFSPDWKRNVYDGIVKNMKERQRNAHHYLFLDPPTSCTVTQGRTFKFIGKPKVTTGMGGLVVVRRDGMVFDSNELLFYMLDENGDVQLTIPHESLRSYTIEPKLYEYVTVSESHSGFLPLVPPTTLRKIAAFRKAKIKELPPFE